MKIKLSILGLFLILVSCGKNELLEMAEYNTVVDYESNFFAVPFDMSYISSVREKSTETLYFYSNKDKSHTNVHELEDSLLAFHQHLWNFDGSKIYYRIGERIVNSRRQGMFEYDVESGQTNEIVSRFDILDSQPNGTIYNDLTEKPDGSMLILNNEYIWLKKENKSLTLNQFLDENGMMNISNQYWFFWPSDSNYIVGHSKFIRWDKQGNLIVLRNFVQKKDTTRIQLLYKLEYSESKLSVLDSAISVHENYDFDTDEYFTMNYSDIVRNSKNDSSSTKIGTLFLNYYAIKLYPISKTNSLLIQAKKNITVWTRYNRVLLLDLSTGTMTNPFTKIVVSTINEIDEVNSLCLVTQTLENEKIVIMKTDLLCQNLEIISDLNMYSRYPQKRPGLN